MSEANKGSISEETAVAILDAAWALFVDQGRVDASMAEIARYAGVTRQTVYLAYRTRPGLLVAMARRADARSVHSRRMADLAAEPEPTAETLIAFIEAWLAHLPEIFPVGRLLIAASATDPDAAAVLRDRMESSLHAKYLVLLRALAGQKRLRPNLTGEDAADMVWSLTHLDAWRHLVVDRGWSPDDFRRNRIDLLRVGILSSTDEA